MRMIGCVSRRPTARCAFSASTRRSDGVAIRAKLGVCPQQDTLDTELTVRQNLMVYARYFGIRRRAARAKADELLEFVQLTERANARSSRCPAA